MATDTHVDVLIVGAGISGIGAAYYLQDKCPNKSYAIVERRENFGGTWDLFRYPGIRSDSDMYTFGYAFAPWKNPNSMAQGEDILAYLDETATKYDIHDKIRYGHQVKRASWSTEEARWTVEMALEETGEPVRMTCNFLFMCAGYYNYDEGYTPEFKGIERFGGRVVHPQKWTDDVDYEGKRVVVIGSGATAVTLIPELAKRAAHVTMLQRSPTYVMTTPGQDRIANWLRAHLPEKLAHGITRWKNVIFTLLFYLYCRRWPERAKRLIVGQVREALGEEYDVEKHFTPHYNPWDQRLCFAPDGDFFEVLKAGTASVTTDEIDEFTERGIALRSGDTLDADLIITATGLQVQFLGGLEVVVDGRRVDLPSTFAYKAMMCSDVPNLALAIGYTNASYTLKVDLTGEYVCRLINHMDKHGYDYCCPRLSDPKPEEIPLLDLTSGYVQRNLHKLPRQGSELPWRVYQNYARDLMAFRFSSVEDGTLEFAHASEQPHRERATRLVPSRRRVVGDETPGGARFGRRA